MKPSLTGPPPLLTSLLIHSELYLHVDQRHPEAGPESLQHREDSQRGLLHEAELGGGDPEPGAGELCSQDLLLRPLRVALLVILEGRGGGGQRSSAELIGPLRVALLVVLREEMTGQKQVKSQFVS